MKNDECKNKQCWSVFFPALDEAGVGGGWILCSSSQMSEVETGLRPVSHHFERSETGVDNAELKRFPRLG